MSQSETTPPEISIRESDSSGSNPKPRRFRRIVLGTVLAHLVGLVALLFWYIPNQQTATQSKATQNAKAGSSSGRGESKDVAATEMPSEQIQASIDLQLEQVENMSDEKKLTELEKNLERLDSIASEESVVQVSQKIASSLGLDTEQYQPKDKDAIPDGEFDFDTAQISDVTRTTNDKGKLLYRATMVDAEGRETNVDLSVAEGETMYNTMEQLKKYPMAAGIYRSVVMPLTQKLIEAQRATEKVAKEAERIQREQAKTDAGH